MVWRPSHGPVPAGPPPGRLVAAATTGPAHGYLATATDDGWRLRVPGVCDFVVDAERSRLECRLDPSSDEAFVAVLVTGLAVSFVLGLAGHCVLHASAVSVDGRAIAFTGPSGAGKSTLASLLCAAGAYMLTDDVLRIAVGPGGPVCVGGAPELRLRPGTAWALDEYATTPTTRVTVDDRLAVRPARPRDHDHDHDHDRKAATATALGLIVLPRLSREATSIALSPVTGALALATLASACRVTGWRDPALVRAHFDVLAEIAGTVPVREALIPWDPALRPTIAAPLIELLRRGVNP